MSTHTDSDELQRRTIPVVGMTCDACEKRVARALLRIPGVESVDVSARRGAAVLRGAPLPSADRVEAAIRSAGYEPGTPSWLTGEASAWVTVALSALAIGALVVLASSLGLGGLIGDLTNPSRGGILLVLALGLTAGFSTCMAMVGGLVLGLSASHAAARTREGQVLPSFVTRMRPQPRVRSRDRPPRPFRARQAVNSIPRPVRLEPVVCRSPLGNAPVTTTVPARAVANLTLRPRVQTL